MNKTIISYYSQTGQSKRIAKMLGSRLHADLAEIRTVRTYNDDMWIADEEAKAELRAGKLPELAGTLPDISGYDTIIIGGPVWAQTISNPLLSYMEQVDFSGKTVSSFWTFYDHDENYNSDMKKKAKNAKVIAGLKHTEENMMEFVTLNNGVKMPKLGFGVFQMTDIFEATKVIRDAISVGYRLIDTAAIYGNEEAVGKAVKESDIPRDEFFITTKLWYKDAGYEKTKAAFQSSLDKLQIEYVDLYLIHQPYGDYYGSWRAMAELYREGKIKALGVSNFYDDRLVDFCISNDVIPAVCQRETHPYNQQWLSQKWMEKYNVQLEAWAPLGRAGSGIFDEEILRDIAAAHDKTPAQVMLRWLMQRDIIAIPKSSHIERMRENMAIFDFSLTNEEMECMKQLDKLQGVDGLRHDDPRMIELLQSF